MVIFDLGINVEGGLSMIADKARYVNGKKGTSKPKIARSCVHQRMVESHYNEKSQPSGNLVCRECGAVLPDPVATLG